MMFITMMILLFTVNAKAVNQFEWTWSNSKHQQPIAMPLAQTQVITINSVVVVTKCY